MMILSHLLPHYKQPHQVCCDAQSLVLISGSLFAFLEVSFLVPVLYFFPHLFVLLVSAPSDLFGVTLAVSGYLEDTSASPWLLPV